VGRSAAEVLSPWQSIVETYGGVSEAQAEIKVGREEREHVYDLSISSLSGTGRSEGGRLVVLRDITMRVRAERELRAANENLSRNIAEISALRDRLKEESIRDPLTRLYNRRFLDEYMDREFTRADRIGTPVSVVILDIDFFKRYNDEYGHLAGDAMLESLGNLLSKSIRGGDMAFRYGGEEFVLVFTAMPLAGALTRTDELRIAFDSFRLPYEGRVLRASLSAGIAVYPLHGETRDEVLRAADAALYRAKVQGRNRVVAFSANPDREL